jgi:hypothetical protein
MLATVLGCIFATIAAAADHQWKVAGGVYNAGRHSANQHLTFKVEGDNVAGTVAGSQYETPISNGKLNGDALTFTAERPFGMFTYKGKVSADGNPVRSPVQRQQLPHNREAHKVMKALSGSGLNAQGYGVPRNERAPNPHIVGTCR